MRQDGLSILLVALSSACTSQGGNTTSWNRIIDDKQPCPTCRVVLKPVVDLRDSSDSTSVRSDAAGRDCMVGRLASGEYVVSGLEGGGHLNVYDRTGTLRRTIGRRGQGPGEFGGRLRLAVGAGDTLYVVDDSQRRVQVFTANGQFLRTFSAPASNQSFALLGTGEIAFFRPPARTTDSLFVLVNETGDAIAKFGAPTRVSDIDLETWVLSPRSPDGFWAASIFRYEVQKWNASHAIEGSLTRKVDWFPPDGDFPKGAYLTVPPPPMLVHVSEDSAGRLWTYSAVPDPEWTAGMPMRPSPEWYRRTFDTVIEVIDLKSGRLIAAGRHASRLGSMCGSPLLYELVETSDGDTFIRVLEPTVADATGAP